MKNISIANIRKINLKKDDALVIYYPREASNEDVYELSKLFEPFLEEKKNRKKMNRKKMNNKTLNINNPQKRKHLECSFQI